MSTKKQNFIRKFKKHSDYVAFLESEDFITPNVSGCEEELHVHYNPKSNKGVTGVTLNRSTMTVPPASEHSGFHWDKIIATVLPEDAPNKEVVWTSSDETKLILGTGLRPWIQVLADTGTCEITVTTVDGGYTAKCDITIDTIKPNGLEPDYASMFDFYVTDDGRPWTGDADANIIQALFCIDIDSGGFYPSDTRVRFVRTGGTITEFEQESNKLDGIYGIVKLGAKREYVGGTLEGYVEPVSECIGTCGECRTKSVSITFTEAPQP